ncbi:unnamed protein product [Caenorhabditis brenneri]
MMRKIIYYASFSSLLLLVCSFLYGPPVHRKFLALLQTSPKTFQFLDYLRSASATSASKLIYPVTRRPVIPFPQDNLYEFQGIQCRENLIPEARILCGENNSDLRRLIFSKRSAIDKVDSMLRIVFDLEKTNFGILPEDARIVSIKNDGFKHGKESHEFEPIDGRKTDSYYCWQMFGNNRIQVTYYVEDEVSYVAGFCIYIESPWERKESYREDVVKECIKYRKYIGASECTSLNSVHLETVDLDDLPEELTVKFCPKIQRNVMSTCQNGVVIHQEWDKYEHQMKNERCEECTKKEEAPPEYSTIAMV